GYDPVQSGREETARMRPAADVDTETDALENEIGKLRERIAALHKEREPEPVADYELTGPDGAPVRLSALFGDRPDLILVHNMGRKCPMCTLWADGFNGIAHHLANRAA